MSSNSKQTHFFSTQPVIEEGSEDGPVPLVLGIQVMQKVK
jgi:hypothetical protein